MSDIREREIYDSWDLNIPQLPNRSILFHLEPMGMNTSHVESLTGYMIRLAEAHCVPLTKLYRKVIYPYINKKYLILNATVFFEKCRTANGLGVAATDLVYALSMLTKRDDLSNLTLINWNNFIPWNGLLRDYRVWCPLCFQELSDNGQTIYEQLIWKFKSIELCSIHQTRLVSECHFCKSSSQAVISTKSRVGYCSKCGAWLGQDNDFYEADPITEEEMLWHKWVTDNVGSLFKQLPPPHIVGQEGYAAKFIKQVVDERLKGSMNEFSYLHGVESKSISNWYYGRVTPSLDALLKIGFVYEVPLLEIFNQNVTLKYISKKHINTKITPYSQKWVFKEIEEEKIISYLEQVLSIDTPPFPSMVEVSQNIGISAKRLRYRFPNLCKQISENYMKELHRQKKENDENNLKQVRHITIELHEKGIYPHFRTVRDVNPKMFWTPNSYSVWRNTMIELGLRK
ncbi:hypothetical protein BRE01_58150 [Brevibacillus reuszeri]|uniref:TniQ domain-containing protein n=1 Tax=Brevibacillus reuszeri TaxID=54915 RepID=A0A0K9YZN2_9BACL|nr:TniQ family protein [Brevibacillus reuszeri]KNB74193.1 hypothetical protein ADS79_03215 [Brevibacillus reuszeri]MED1861192.1 TniQ family protein [Brevibacillus reuszeri]GED72113.1 hypothetical protein BRE01_58150 [Brevibacillus reuszeri]